MRTRRSSGVLKKKTSKCSKCPGCIEPEEVRSRNNGKVLQDGQGKKKQISHETVVTSQLTSDLARIKTSTDTSCSTVKLSPSEDQCCTETERNIEDVVLIENETMKIDTKNYCLFCYKLSTTKRKNDSEDGKEDEDVTDTGTRKEICSRYLKMLTRYLKLDIYRHVLTSNYSSFRQNFFVRSLRKDEDFFDIVVCDDCFLVLKAFCDYYNQFQHMQLRLDWNVEKLRNIMKFAEKVPSRISEFRTNVLEGQNGMREEEKRLMDGFRREFFRNSIPKRYPKVTLCKTGGGGKDAKSGPEKRKRTVLLQTNGKPLNDTALSAESRSLNHHRPIQVLTIGQELCLKSRDPNDVKDNVQSPTHNDVIVPDPEKVFQRFGRFPFRKRHHGGKRPSKITLNASRLMSKQVVAKSEPSLSASLPIATVEPEAKSKTNLGHKSSQAQGPSACRDTLTVAISKRKNVCKGNVVFTKTQRVVPKLKTGSVSHLTNSEAVLPARVSNNMVMMHAQTRPRRGTRTTASKHVGSKRTTRQTRRRLDDEVTPTEHPINNSVPKQSKQPKLIVKLTPSVLVTKLDENAHQEKSITADGSNKKQPKPEERVIAQLDLKAITTSETDYKLTKTRPGPKSRTKLRPQADAAIKLELLKKSDSNCKTNLKQTSRTLSLQPQCVGLLSNKRPSLLESKIPHKKYTLIPAGNSNNSQASLVRDGSLKAQKRKFILVLPRNVPRPSNSFVEEIDLCNSSDDEKEEQKNQSLQTKQRTEKSTNASSLADRLHEMPASAPSKKQKNNNFSKRNIKKVKKTKLSDSQSDKSHESNGKCSTPTLTLPNTKEKLANPELECGSGRASPSVPSASNLRPSEPSPIPEQVDVSEPSFVESFDTVCDDIMQQLESMQDSDINSAEDSFGRIPLEYSSSSQPQLGNQELQTEYISQGNLTESHPGPIPFDDFSTYDDQETFVELPAPPEQPGQGIEVTLGPSGAEVRTVSYTFTRTVTSTFPSAPSETSIPIPALENCHIPPIFPVLEANSSQVYNSPNLPLPLPTEVMYHPVDNFGSTFNNYNNHFNNVPNVGDGFYALSNENYSLPSAPITTTESHLSHPIVTEVDDIADVVAVGNLSASLYDAVSVSDQGGVQIFEMEDDVRSVAIPVCHPEEFTVVFQSTVVNPQGTDDDSDPGNIQSTGGGVQA